MKCDRPGRNKDIKPLRKYCFQECARKANNTIFISSRVRKPV